MDVFVRRLFVLGMSAFLVSSTRAAAQGFDFQFNEDGVLPSAQFAQFMTTGPTESSVYSVFGGILYQNTLPFSAIDSYYQLDGIFDHHFPATLEWQIKVGHSQDKGVIVSLGTPGRYWIFNVADTGIETNVGCSGCWAFVVSMNTTDAYHTYRLVVPANSDAYDLYVDGQLRYSGLALGAANQPTYFGDATTSGGNASAEWNYITLTNPIVSYEICALYDQTKAARSGSAIPIKFQLCDANGVNESSNAIPVRALSVSRVSDNAPGTLQDEGNANEDDAFRYSADLVGGTGGYIFNLSTRGYATGTYRLNFKAGDDPATHFVQFQVR